MRRVHVGFCVIYVLVGVMVSYKCIIAVISIVTMISFELILFHGKTFYKLTLWARYESCGIMAGHKCYELWLALRASHKYYDL